MQSVLPFSSYLLWWKLSRGLLGTRVASQKGVGLEAKCRQLSCVYVALLSLSSKSLLPSSPIFFRKMFRKSVQRRLAGTKLGEKRNLWGLFPLLLRPQRITWPKKIKLLNLLSFPFLFLSFWTCFPFFTLRLRVFSVQHWFLLRQKYTAFLQALPKQITVQFFFPFW